MKRKIIKILIFFLIWSFVFETGINSYASESQCLISNTIYVDDDNVDGPWDGTKAHPYQYIKDGIGAADDGDTVFVKNGVYLEEFEIFKEINLFGENSEKTIIKPFFYQSYVIIVYSDNVNIKGFQIQDALNAIQISGNSITVEENIFKNNIDGIYVNHFFYSNNFHNNIFLNNERGILLDNAQNTIITSNNFTDNDIGIEIIGNHNNIESNIFFKNNYGIRIGNPYLDASYRNNIKYNNFISNKISAYDYFDFYRFIKGFNNWHGNYWDIPRLYPKFIPQLSVDWNPAKRPNEIRV